MQESSTPQPVVVRGWTYDPAPGVRVMSLTGETVPTLIIHEQVTSDELMAAVEHVGHSYRCVVALRKAAKAWLRSPEAADYPPCREEETRDEAVLRWREGARGVQERLRQHNLEQFEQMEQERLAAMTDAERAIAEARKELTEEFVRRWDELGVQGVPASA